MVPPCTRRGLRRCSRQTIRTGPPPKSYAATAFNGLLPRRFLAGTAETLPESGDNAKLLLLFASLLVGSFAVVIVVAVAIVVRMSVVCHQSISLPGPKASLPGVAAGFPTAPAGWELL